MRHPLISPFPMFIFKGAEDRGAPFLSFHFFLPLRIVSVWAVCKVASLIPPSFSHFFPLVPNRVKREGKNFRQTRGKERETEKEALLGHFLTSSSFSHVTESLLFDGEKKRTGERGNPINSCLSLLFYL